jgi:putative NADH-flavin reductase
MAAKLIGPKRLVIVGATGMVGGYALRYALEHPAVGHITAIGRRTVGISHPKLKQVLHKDFADCSALAESLSGHDAVVFCLGTYTGSVQVRGDVCNPSALKRSASQSLVRRSPGYKVRWTPNPK